jgi:ABC-type transporter Mla MlaB component
MLRISESEGKGTSFRLDGSLTGPWVHELKLMSESKLADGGAIQIDCGGITFIDAAGVALMRGLQSRGVRLVNCSPFIKMQLAQNGPNPEGSERP